jgi:hypothetical protein
VGLRRALEPSSLLFKKLGKLVGKFSAEGFGKELRRECGLQLGRGFEREPGLLLSKEFAKELYSLLAR